MADDADGTGGSDRRDRREAIRIALGLLAIVALLALGLMLLGPSLEQAVAQHLAPGLGLRSAFAWGFGVTVALFIAFAVVAGEGVIGELPVMLATFLAFWVIFSLTVAWIF